VPYAPLWGFLAAVLRFVPFVGTTLGMVLPALLAFAQLPGWWPTLATVAVFLGLDLVVAYVIEPMAIGRRTGVSSTAMIVAAIFWTWLWGPIGLLLSGICARGYGRTGRICPSWFCARGCRPGRGTAS
jgi:predicted PurR-regulated permease PerM